MDYSDDEIINMESGEDISYSDDDRELDYGFAEVIMKPSQKSYIVLKQEDIHKHQRDDIERVSTVISLSRVEAIVLLLHYHWNVSKVEESIRKTIGILKEHVVNIKCGICFEPYTREEIATVACGHPYCLTCSTGYITTQINDGPGCLIVKCPEPSCSTAVGQDMIEKVSKDVDKEKYYRYFLRSYVEEDGKNMKWCPGAGCEYAIDFGVGSGSVSGSSCYDVYCLCSNSLDGIAVKTLTVLCRPGPD